MTHRGLNHGLLATCATVVFGVLCCSGCLRVFGSIDDPDASAIHDAYGPDGEPDAAGDGDVDADQVADAAPDGEPPLPDGDLDPDGAVDAGEDADVDGCLPRCAGRECGADGCGGSCPPGCEPTETCAPSGTCVEIAPGDWVTISAGSFDMGSPGGEVGRQSDETLHPVTLSRSFVMLATEVTQGEFLAQMGVNPSDSPLCGDSCPVENVDWHDAAAYCNALSAASGLDACYACSGAGTSWTCAPAGALVGTDRTRRGGSWNDDGHRARSASRRSAAPGGGSNVRGFRPVRTLPP